ncbi:hypothetical protein ASF44_28860 [Pseudorhodoferax sp. Leaf274]|nr:hypothetical protein ASF44_28860 [Pseudorhodoferax sp. Leaf274]
MTVPRFEELDGFGEIVAILLEPGLLSVQLIGEERFLHAAGTAMMHGPIDAQLQTVPIRMRHFSVVNQGDRRRIMMTVHFEHVGVAGPPAA